MTAWQLPPQIWSRGAIHDSSAAIVRQQAYNRDVRTLLDRLVDWIHDLFSRFMNALGGVPYGRFFAAIALGGVALLVLGRIAYASRLRASPTGERSRSRRIRGESANLWSEAERLAGGGHYTEAAHALYRATLSLLAAGGHVRLHNSKTSGDYARELRRRGDRAYTAFRRFGGHYDRLIYGTGNCDAAEYAVLLADANAVAAIRAIERAA